MGEYWKKKNWKIRAQEDLPFLPTPHTTIKSIFSFLKEKKLIHKKQKFVDLGAGDGRVIIHVAELYHLKALGLEIDNNLINSAKSVIKEKKLTELCQIIERDFYNYDISKMDIIYCFLLPSNYPYCHHLVKSIKSGAIIISIRWPLDDFNEYWSESFVLKTIDQFDVFIYKHV